MKLLTKEIIKKFPKIYEMDGKPADKVPVVAKFFVPWGAASWYATEYDGEDTFFGFANLGDDQCAELGYFSLSELESIKGPAGMKIERDIYFEANLKEVKEFAKR